MKYAFDHLQAIRELLLAHDKITLLTDFDGTLTPIQEHPDLAILSEDIRQILLKFSQSRIFFLGIITGRSLRQIKKLVNIPKILYAANHGIELEGPGIRFSCAEAKKARYNLWHVYMRLFNALRHIEGIYLEDKGYAVSLHYRLVKKARDTEFVTKTLDSIIKPYLEKKILSLCTGKMVYEIRPPVTWNKATTIQWLLTNYLPLAFSGDALLVYLGDDQADIEVFTALSGKKLTIFVGTPTDTSAADYYVHSPEEVKSFLEFLYKQKDEGHHDLLTEGKRAI
ncbi:MAG: trehalose-phosphatase [Candidatus Brocadia sp.]|jgi:trehalose-phosphatase|uniref:Trehalose 6-phosphate phosphatase n=1 Tax=Candidatus Brocadia fulgida TaxID=380242 RepID=A0A0M2V0X3_9BACT|nr:MAG: putative trehalose-6-phosphate phosphatase [Candidatus Brocadia fulgida]MCC6325995.1 trehalose-phosphatase [Candidatus Brocadia sp.]MCE7911964.1 trehalose-phosphatase [Candidatus Brocadia sp. AMX3]OQZ00002.1 MAG: trehalose-phosphatase [Candidatus Brocadia sp. UTAMX2]MBV6519868.1 Trehalose-phosphate phosphatase [Candidatus Brocadia fulgida]